MLSGCLGKDRTLSESQDVTRQPDAPRWADAWAAERGKKSEKDWDAGGAILVVSGGIGVAVYFGCQRWHNTWASLSLDQLALKGHEPLAAQYPWVSAIVATLIALFICRVLIFFHRLESR
jgi:hypothetical protein